MSDAIKRGGPEDLVQCGCDEFPECTHSLYWYEGYKVGKAALAALPASPVAPAPRLLDGGGPTNAAYRIWNDLTEFIAFLGPAENKYKAIAAIQGRIVEMLNFEGVAQQANDGSALAPVATARRSLADKAGEEMTPFEREYNFGAFKPEELPLVAPVAKGETGQDDRARAEHIYNELSDPAQRATPKEAFIAVLSAHFRSVRAAGTPEQVRRDALEKAARLCERLTKPISMMTPYGMTTVQERFMDNVECAQAIRALAAAPRSATYTFEEVVTRLTPSPGETAQVPISVPLAEKSKEELVRIVEMMSEDMNWYVAERNRLLAAQPAGTPHKSAYILGRSTIEKVANDGQLDTEQVAFVAADELFHRNPYAAGTPLVCPNCHGEGEGCNDPFHAAPQGQQGEGEGKP